MGTSESVGPEQCVVETAAGRAADRTAPFCGKGPAVSTGRFARGDYRPARRRAGGG